MIMRYDIQEVIGLDEELKESKIVTMRFEKEMIDKIDAEAKMEHRNRTQQIIHMIDRYYELKKLLEK